MFHQVLNSTADLACNTPIFLSNPLGPCFMFSQVSIPTILQQLLPWLISSSDGSWQLPQLQLLVSSGEPLPLSLAQRLLQVIPHTCCLVNLYGELYGRKPTDSCTPMIGFRKFLCNPFLLHAEGQSKPMWGNFLSLSGGLYKCSLAKSRGIGFWSWLYRREKLPFKAC